MFDAISFAGGGNRCYWQGGFFEALRERFDMAPALAVGASAGAFAGIYSLLGLGHRVRERVLASCGPHRRNVDLAGWRRGEPLYPVGPLYRALIEDVLDARALRALNARTDFRLALTRLPRGLPPLLGAALGITAYQLEKHLLGPVHPRFGRRLGFRPEFVSVRDLASPAALADALIASSCVPPFMPITQVNGAPAFDGGLVDNVPVHAARADRSRGRPHAGAADAQLPAPAGDRRPQLRPAFTTDRRKAVRPEQSPMASATPMSLVWRMVPHLPGCASELEVRNSADLRVQMRQNVIFLPNLNLLHRNTDKRCMGRIGGPFVMKG